MELCKRLGKDGLIWGGGGGVNTLESLCTDVDDWSVIINVRFFSIIQLAIISVGYHH